MVQKILGKSDISKERKKRKKQKREKDADSCKETKQNNRNTREGQHDIRLEDTSSRQLWLINYGERTTTSPLALGYPLLGSSLHVRAYYHCMS